MPRHFSADEEALLKAIHADPRADLPRLVYADWLDDHGEADQAEFIRIEIALANQPSLPPFDDPLRVRQRELSTGIYAEPARPFPRRMCYRGRVRGLHSFRIAHPHTDLDLVSQRIESNECLLLELLDPRPQVYCQALCHHVMEQVHFISLPVVDEYDVLAMSETACSFRPVTLSAEYVYPSAFQAQKTYLPNVVVKERLRDRPMSHRLRRLRWDHRNRFQSVA